MKILTTISQWIIALSVPMLLVIGSVRIAMTETFLQIEYTRPGFPTDTYGFTTDDRLEYGVYGIRYILNSESIDYLGDLTLPGEVCYPPRPRPCSMYNDSELQHMEDVKTVAQGAFAAGIGILIISGFAIGWLRQSEKHQALRTALANGARITLGAIAGIVVSALVAWDFFFDTFHALFFEDGTWRFFYSDTLIRLYPEQFWFDASLLIGGLTVLGALLVLALSRRIASN